MKEKNKDKAACEVPSQTLREVSDKTPFVTLSSFSSVSLGHLEIKHNDVKQSLEPGKNFTNVYYFAIKQLQNCWLEFLYIIIENESGVNEFQSDRRTLQVFSTLHSVPPL